MKVINGYNRIDVYVCLKVCIVLCAVFKYSDMQRIRYAMRFRNATVYSETGSAYVINMTIFQFKMEHRIKCWVNITKDVFVKKVHIMIKRCHFETYLCESFQTWRFEGHLVTKFAYMKNQMWSPLTYNIVPRVDFPTIKKNIYSTNNATLSTEALISYYPEYPKYIWKGDAVVINQDDKEEFVVSVEVNVFEYVERDRKKTKGDRP